MTPEETEKKAALWGTLYKLGLEMRQQQKEYFKTRSKSALINSKQLESEFDKQLLLIAQDNDSSIQTLDV